jgi:hypothetical protein
MVEHMGLKSIALSPLAWHCLLPNFMKIYHVVQKISIDPLYVKPAMPLGHFCSTVNNLVTIFTMVA